MTIAIFERIGFIAICADLERILVSMNHSHLKGWHAFEVYYNTMLEGDLLGSHWMSRKLARAVIHPQDCAGTRLLGRCMDFLPIETLPLKVRDRLELQSTISSHVRRRRLV